MASYLGRVAILAALYVTTGALGLLLAVPPGYATVIWPPSGIAIGMLVAGGSRLWPGIFAGSFVLNAYQSGVFADADWTSARTLAAAGIALGSTVQALAGRYLIARVVGLPLRLESFTDIARLLGVAGPLTCVIAASAGVASLSLAGLLAPQAMAANWLAWWSGDTLGVLLFMPLVMLAPGNREQLTWRSARIGRLPTAALLLMMLPLGLTFYLWKAATENDYQRGSAKFDALTLESENALQNRLASYSSALLGAAGFVQGSTEVSREEWRTYVETLGLEDNFPGISGIGWIQNVPPGAMASFLAATRADGVADFAVHPLSTSGPHYIITYIEPQAENRAALGLDITFEEHRRAAAERARDTGEAAMSGTVALVQYPDHPKGFLVLHPVYRRGAALDTTEQRRSALQGWTYGPFIASRLLADLTHGQNRSYRLRIYDGNAEDDASLIYASGTGPDTATTPAFGKRISLDILQRQWLLVWESTPEFEREERSANPLFILIGGLVFTALLALLLIVLTVRRTEQVELMVGARHFVVPLAVFAVLVAGSFALYWQLRALETEFVRSRVQDEANRIEALLRASIDERVGSIRRIARRWETAPVIDETAWRVDAADHVAQLPGLRALEWVGPDYRVHWVEPEAGNEAAVGYDILSDPDRADAIRAAAQRTLPTITPPLNLVQGYAGFIAYVPVRRAARFDGFIAGVFSIDDFFHDAISADLSRDFTMAILHGRTEYFTNTLDATRPQGAWIDERIMRIGEESWTLRVAPTAAFVGSQSSQLPLLTLVAGLLVATLSALSVRVMLVSRLKSLRLAESLALNAGIISSSAHLVIAIDAEYRIMIFNRAAEQALGYAAPDVIGHRAIPIFMDPLELEARARTLSDELGEHIPVGPDIFTRIPLRDGYEKREWTFIRKNGTRFPVNVIITPLRDQFGEVNGFLGVIEDITLAREMERMKSEFTAVVSHELRTPLTSIRGSLGLILGAMADTLPAKVRELLEIAQANCERLVLLINDILDVEKFSAGQMRFEFRVVPLGPVVRQAVEANEGYARRHDVRYELTGLPDDWHVKVDPERFIQVMSNLLSNAVKYSPADGTVKVWGEQRDGAYRVSVSDDGPGIPEEFRPHIFEKFSQADSSTTRNKGGTGLGLHIARRFTEHMRGRIGFESTPGRGATFWVELPPAGRGNH